VEYTKTSKNVGQIARHSFR